MQDIYIKPSTFLDDQITQSQRSLIPSAIEQAYRLADEVAAENPIFNVESASIGRMRSWATDLVFIRLIESGAWPFDYDWKPFNKPTGKYLRIKLESSLMSISLVKGTKNPPRRVGFRANNALGNAQPDMFEDYTKEKQIEGLPSFILVHGHTTPEFAHIGMPHPEYNSWKFITPNIFTELRNIVTTPKEEVAQVEADQEAVISLKETLRKWQRDNKKND